MGSSTLKNPLVKSHVAGKFQKLLLTPTNGGKGMAPGSGKRIGSCLWNLARRAKLILSKVTL